MIGSRKSPGNKPRWSPLNTHTDTHIDATLAGWDRGLQHTQSGPHLCSFVLRDKTTPIVTHTLDAPLER